MRVAHRRRRSAAAAVVFVVVVGLATILGAPPAHSSTAADYTQLQAFALSRDGTKIAFTVWPNNSINEPDGLYVADRDGSNPVRLVSGAAYDPDFAPGGSTIAYSAPGVAGAMDVFTVPAAGGAAHAVTATPEYEESPSYAPSGSTLAIQLGDASGYISQIARLDVATGAKTVLVTTGASPRDPVFTPDGSHVLYTADDDTLAARQILSVPAGGGSPSALTAFGDGHYAAFPDTSRAAGNLGQIVFVDEGDESLVTMAPNGSALTTLESTPTYTTYDDVHWTPGGRVAHLETEHPAPPPATPPTGGGPPTTGPPPTGPTGTGPPGTGTTMPTTTTIPAGGAAVTPAAVTVPTGHLVIPSDPTTATAPPGGSVSSGDEATPIEPVATTATTPTGGTVTIDTVATTAPAPSGYSFAGEQVNITAPPASVADPLVLTFLVDASALAEAGVDASTVVLFRDGSPIATCAGPGPEANPDPCVASRTTLASGDAQIVVRTSHASRWNFGSGPAVVSHATTAAISCTPDHTSILTRHTVCAVTVRDVASSPTRPLGTVRFTDTDTRAELGTAQCTLRPVLLPATMTCSLDIRAGLTGLRSRVDTITATYVPADTAAPYHLAGTASTTVVARGLLF